MSDTIDRQQAIDAARDWYEGLICGSFKGLEKRLRSLPPAQPEPKKGKWNRLDMDTFNCNQCGTTFVLNQGSEKMHFCPNCGAEMEVNSESN